MTEHIRRADDLARRQRRGVVFTASRERNWQAEKSSEYFATIKGGHSKRFHSPS
jgi:hypothetical protein